MDVQKTIQPKNIPPLTTRAAYGLIMGIKNFVNIASINEIGVGADTLNWIAALQEAPEYKEWMASHTHPCRGFTVEEAKATPNGEKAVILWRLAHVFKNNSDIGIQRLAEAINREAITLASTVNLHFGHLTSKEVETTPTAEDLLVLNLK